MHPQPELQDLPAPCQKENGWAIDYISANTPYRGYTAFESRVRYAPLVISDFPNPLFGIVGDKEGGVGYDTDAERSWRNWLEALATTTKAGQYGVPGYHSGVSNKIATLSKLAKEELEEIVGAYEDNPNLRTWPKTDNKFINNARGTLREMYQRALQLMWCALYLRALSDSYYANKAAFLALPGEAATIKLPAGATFKPLPVEAGVVQPPADEDEPDLPLDGGEAGPLDPAEDEEEAPEWDEDEIEEAAEGGGGGGLVAVGIVAALALGTLLIRGKK